MGARARKASVPVHRARSGARASVANLVAKRKVIGPLAQRRVTPNTLRYYDRAIAWFFLYVQCLGHSTPNDVASFDELVGEAIEEAWGSGEGRALVGHLLSGLKFYVPALSGQLRFGWSLWKAWGRLEAPFRAPPLSWIAVRAIAFELMHAGEPDIAVLVVIAFLGFLRTTEFCTLTVGQLVFNSSLTKMQILFPNSKSAQRTGNVEMVHINRPALVKYCHILTRSKVASERLVPSSAAHFRRVFAEAVSTAGLSAQRFKPYSLRRGGATYHFKKFKSLDRTMEVGRWSELKTARVYINTALLELTSMTEFELPSLKVAASAFTRIMLL